MTPSSTGNAARGRDIDKNARERHRTPTTSIVIVRNPDTTTEAVAQVAHNEQAHHSTGSRALHKNHKMVVCSQRHNPSACVRDSDVCFGGWLGFGVRGDPDTEFAVGHGFGFVFGF